MSGLIWSFVSVALTLIVLSYLIGDNSLFRTVLSIFVGITAGITALYLIFQIIIPRVVVPLQQGTSAEKFGLVIPLILSLLLFFKLSTRYNTLGSLTMALIVGVGAAVALRGVISGTLFSQISASIEPFSIPAKATPIQQRYQLLSSAFVLIGTISTLAYFQYTRFTKGTLAKIQSPVQKVIRVMGETFIAITLGAVFAAVLISSFSTLIERLDFVIQFLMKQLGLA